MNSLTLILVVVSTVAAGIGVCRLLGCMGISPFTEFKATIAGYFGGFDLGGVVSNPASVLTAAGGAVAVGIPLLSKLSAAKQQVTTVASKAQSEISGLTDNLSDASSKLSSTQLDLTTAQEKLSSLESANTTLTTQANTYKAQLDKIMGQYTELQKIKAADLIGSLPGGTVITNPDGSQTAVVERKVIV